MQDDDPMQEQANQLAGSQLINEAIKRILFDIVIRGHGDRLIGRWSRVPELQKFLEQVPYMLDRINQLHLACTRNEDEIHEKDKNHHHHHFHHHHGNSVSGSLKHSPLHDLVSLIGEQHHWLIRTRDALGLTPLHKAVLFNNRPIVEYILDRYPDELAAWRTTKTGAGSGSEGAKGKLATSTRLIDAQDKYGRTALHYAAAALNQQQQSSDANGARHLQQCNPIIGHLYHFLVAKGASLDVRDFRGKTPVHYVKHPNQLRWKNIIHLANKLNANYQANVLTKTLRASSEHRTFSSGLPCPTQVDTLGGTNDEGGKNNSDLQSSMDFGQLVQDCAPSGDDTLGVTRESMSASCNDLSQQIVGSTQISQQKRSRSTVFSKNFYPENDKTQVIMNEQDNVAQSANQSQQQTKLTPESFVDTTTTTATSIGGTSSSGFLRSISFENSSGRDGQLDKDLKQLIASRCLRGSIVGQKKKQQMRRTLNEGVIDQVNNLIVEGHGELIIQEAPIACWNLQCKRYIKSVLPNLLVRLDYLHEHIATDQLLACRSLLSEEPILARIRRPYKQASMNALHLAVHLDRGDIAYYLINRFPELLNQRDSNGATCLHWAAKCLRHDRLYCWLLENFSSHLEDLRDSKGKCAADYRRQALKMLSYSTTSGARQQIASGVEQEPNVGALLRRNQQIADKIQAVGTRVGLKSRTNRKQTKRTIQASPELEQPVDLTEDGLGETFIQIDSPSLSIERDEQDLKHSNSLENESQSASIRRFSKQSDGIHTPKLMRKTSGGLAFDHSSFCSDSNNDELLETHSDTVKSTHERDSPLSTPSLPISRPQSVSSNSRAESSILESIQTDDFKRLEHFVLAGCGKRLLSVYESNKWRLEKHGQASFSVSDEGLFMSAKMRNFLEKLVPDYMISIEEIHKTLHLCFANSTNQATSQGDDLRINRTFHRLCNLFDRKRLIVCRDKYGATPLHVAVARSHDRLADYLLKRHPEAASAPDHDGRNILHYAAILVGTVRHHKTFRITTRKEAHSNDDAMGFWLMDANSDTTYDKLSQRYGNELFAKMPDRRGKTCLAYLQDTDKSEHVALEDLESDDSIESFLEPKVLDGCCGDLAEILRRYDYVILKSSKRDAAVNLQVIVEPEGTQRPVSDQNPSSSSEVNQPKPKRRSLMKKAESCDESYVQHQQKTLVKSSKRSRTSDDLLSHLDSNILNHATFEPPESPIIIQVAPRPTVGSSARFTPSPVPIIDNLPNSTGGRPSNEKHAKRNSRHSPMNNSVVGGVIVPTTIHNDKMDEIQTYDIIYRQPVSSANSATGRKSDSARLSSSSKFDRNLVGKSLAPDGSKMYLNGDKMEGDGGVNFETDSSDSEDEDDERVERLSNEFEDRVRREKTELREKVDQIMSEIKLSTKSGRGSSKVLSNNVDPESKQAAGPTKILIAVNNAHRSQSSSSGLSTGSNSCSSASSLGSSSQNQAAITSTCSTVGSVSACESRTSSSSSSSYSSCSSASSTRRSIVDGRRSKSPIQEDADSDVARVRQSKVVFKELDKNDLEDTHIEHNGKHVSIADLSSQLVSKNTYGQTYLHFIASKSQNGSTLYKVLEHGSHLISERDVFYRTARDVALQFNLADNVQILDKYIIDLFIAGKTDSLWQLLNAGYSPLIHVSDSDGNDIMLILKLLKLDRIIKFLLEMADFQRWRDELHTFIRHGYSAGVSELLIKHKDLVKAKSMHARSSVHLAVLFGRVTMLGELLKTDPVSVHSIDNMGRTPLHYSFGLETSPETKEIRSKLLNAGASLDDRDVKMRTPKYYCIFKREIEEIKRIELELN